MLDLVTSVNPVTMFVPASGAVELLAPNPKRVGFIVSAPDEDMSISFRPNVTVGLGMINFIAGITFVYNGCISLYGTAITQPLYAIAGGEGISIEICEVLYDGPKGDMKIR